MSSSPTASPLPTAEYPYAAGPGRQNVSSFPGRLCSGAASRQDPRRGDRREALAQIRKLHRAGIDVTHLDTHKHTHLFPAVTRVLLQLAERCSVGAIRQPFEQTWSLALGHGNRLRRLQVKLLAGLKSRFERQPQIRDARVLTPDGTIGISATGNLYGETLHEILHALPANGTFELCCHPGYNDSDLDRITTRLRTHRDIERKALLSRNTRNCFASKRTAAHQLW